MGSRSTDPAFDGELIDLALFEALYRLIEWQDIVADQTHAECEAIISVNDPELGPVRMQGVIPRLTQHPGAVWRSGPALGQDTDDVLRDYIGMPTEEIATLRHRGVI